MLFLACARFAIAHEVSQLEQRSHELVRDNRDVRRIFAALTSLICTGRARVLFRYHACGPTVFFSPKRTLRLARIGGRCRSGALGLDRVSTRSSRVWMPATPGLQTAGIWQADSARAFAVDKLTAAT